MKTKFYFFALISTLLLGLIIHACVETEEYNANEEILKKSESYEATDRKGNYYQISLERNQGEVTYIKKLIQKNEDSPKQLALHFSVAEKVEEGIKGKTRFILPSGKNYWFIPINGGEPVKIGNSGGSAGVMATTECFCEEYEAGESPDSPTSECEAMSPPILGSGIICVNSWNCGDCDMQWCPDPSRKIYYGAGVIVEANSIKVHGKHHISQYSDDNTSYYAGSIKVQVQKEADLFTIKRKIIDNENNYPKKLINLTSSLIKDGKIALNKNKIYWFIPFDPEIQAFRVVSQPECEKDECTGSCTLEELGNGCFECKCSVSSGDCDMKIGGEAIQSGGFLVENEKINVINN